MRGNREHRPSNDIGVDLRVHRPDGGVRARTARHDVGNPGNGGLARTAAGASLARAKRRRRSPLGRASSSSRRPTLTAIRIARQIAEMIRRATGVLPGILSSAEGRRKRANRALARHRVRWIGGGRGLRPHDRSDGGDAESVRTRPASSTARRRSVSCCRTGPSTKRSTSRSRARSACPPSTSPIVPASRGAARCSTWRAISSASTT